MMNIFARSNAGLINQLALSVYSRQGSAYDLIRKLQPSARLGRMPRNRWRIARQLVRKHIDSFLL